MPSSARSAGFDASSVPMVFRRSLARVIAACAAVDPSAWMRRTSTCWSPDPKVATAVEFSIAWRTSDDELPPVRMESVVMT